MCLAIPMKIIEILPPDRAVVESEGVSMEASMAIVTDAQVGDYVLVHAGFALEKIDIDEAEKTLAILRQIVNADKIPLTDKENESSEKYS